MASLPDDARRRELDELLVRRNHNLRTPLNAILGFADLLLHDEDSPLAPHQRDQLALIIAAGERQQQQLQELVDLSRLSLGRLTLRTQEVDLAAELHAAVADLATAARARTITVSVQADGLAGARVRGDAARVRQVLAKLIGNAIRFSPTGRTVQVRGTRDGAQAHVEVVDAGPGLTEAQRALLFSPYAHAERDAAGLRGGSVGLAVAQGLTQAMGGQLQVSAAEGGGCCLRMSVPLLSPL